MPGLYSAYVSPQQRAIDEAAAQKREPPVDWLRLIKEINAKGISRKRLSLAINVSHATVEGWEKGSIPNYEAGRRLIMAHGLLVEGASSGG